MTTIEQLHEVARSKKPNSILKWTRNGIRYRVVGVSVDERGYLKILHHTTFPGNYEYPDWILYAVNPPLVEGVDGIGQIIAIVERAITYERAARKRDGLKRREEKILGRL